MKTLFKVLLLFVLGFMSQQNSKGHLATFQVRVRLWASIQVRTGT
jgi:hypothetical protein